MSSLIPYDRFAELFRLGGMNIDEIMYKKFSLYAEMLCEWNEKINLTAITDPEGIALKHFYDSVYPFMLIPPKERAVLIDVGTGAGFPSLPFKIYRSDIDITLLDSLNKRITFLSEISNKLQINARCIHGRAEETARSKRTGNPMRGVYDIATARAVANLRELCEYCLPFVKVGGNFYALKGRSGITELIESQNAVKLLGGVVSDLKEYSLPNGDERVLIVIRKIKPTPQKYPRNAGQMKKNPL